MDQVGGFLNTIFKGINPDPNSPRTMKFPYTLGAQIAQFPYRYYWNNQWIFKYWIISIALCTPLFMKISKAANSPANKAKWAEQQKKDKAEHAH